MLIFTELSPSCLLGARKKAIKQSRGALRIRAAAILSLQMTRESAPLAGVTVAGQSHVLF